MATFRKLPSGAIRAEVSCKGRRSSKSFPTKQAAKEWAARQEFRITESAEAPVDHGTFGDVLKRYANEVSPSRRGERWEILKIRNFRSDPISSYNMADLTPEVFAKWRDKRLSEVQPATVSREMQLMSAVLNCARKEWSMLTVNPLSDVRKPKKPEPRNRLPLPDDMERMAYAAGDDLSTATARAFHAFRFAIQTAMRAGEIVGLTWDRVDLQRRVARLDRTKNGRSREVPLFSEAVRLLQALPKTDQVFNLTSAQIDALWRKVRDKSQDVGLKFHDSRHAAITALSKKLDVLALARMVGHKDLRMLQVYYKETAEELAKRLDQVMLTNGEARA
ncbi:site-specific integrase [Gemmobacter sp. 24YEA27]|uniref:tyrosine-type recombinase/integrase n=1 Tax=Gemmobacter sp. 24YEA27 TaxID=3040672 RepID=UPI0024B387BA|nr:site-specific integrase [Gemmobacter sp. 24YEA27]